MDAGDRDAEPEPEPHGSAPRLLRTAILVAVALVLVGAGLLVPGARTDDPGRYSPADVEHRLATVDGVRTTEATLVGYGQVLDAAAARCTQDRAVLAERAVEVRAAAHADGAVRATAQRILERVARAAGPGRADCGPAFAEAAQRTARCQPAGDRPCGY